MREVLWITFSFFSEGKRKPAEYQTFSKKGGRSAEVRLRRFSFANICWAAASSRSVFSFSALLSPVISSSGLLRNCLCRIIRCFCWFSQASNIVIHLFTFGKLSWWKHCLPHITRLPIKRGFPQFDPPPPSTEQFIFLACVTVRDIFRAQILETFKFE